MLDEDIKFMKELSIKIAEVGNFIKTRYPDAGYFQLSDFLDGRGSCKGVYISCDEGDTELLCTANLDGRIYILEKEAEDNEKNNV